MPLFSASDGANGDGQVDDRFKSKLDLFDQLLKQRAPLSAYLVAGCRLH